MKYYDNNIECLKKNHYALYNMIQECHDEEQYKDIIVQSISTRDGNRALQLEKDSAIYRLNSLYKPVEEANKWISQYKFNNLDIVICMFGLGNGIFLREVMNKIQNQGTIIIYEPSLSIFLHVINNYDIYDILNSNNISIVIKGVNTQELKSLLNEYIDWINMNFQMQFVHPQYDVIFRNEYNDFMKVLQEHNTAQIMNRNTASFLGKAVSRNTICNLKYISDSNITSDLLSKFPQEIPAIIVGAGPSLDLNINELKKAKGESVIFATDSSLKYLFAHDIIPDFVVTLDALKSEVHFKDERWREVPLLCSIESKSTIVDVHRGKKVFYNIGKYLESTYLDCGKNLLRYSTGGSVTTACFSICANLGFKRIVLIGQDLAYKGDYTHAGNVTSNVRGNGINTLLVKDIYGNMVKTRYDWNSYIQWFNEAMPICKEHNIEVIDATEGGAFIEGTKIMRLSEVIHKYCNIPIDCSTIIEEMNPTFSESEKALFKKNQIKAMDDLLTIENEVMKAYTYCDRLIKATKKNQLESYANQSLIKEITKINNSIKSQPVYYLIDDYILDVTTSQLSKINEGTDDLQTNQFNVYTRAKDIYKAIADAAKELQILFQKTIATFK